jgi:TorA maturation chaperone TorD
MHENRDWALWAQLCELVSFSLRYPGAEQAQALADGSWEETARDLAREAGLDLASAAFDELGAWRGGLGEDALLDELRRDATALFVGTPHAEVSPYEGVWRAGDVGVQPLLFVNPASMEVERYFKACGLAMRPDLREPIDHVATEFELLSYLALAAAGRAEVAEGVQFPGGSPQAAWETFWSEHVCGWVPRFADEVAVRARTPFYRAVAALLQGVLAAG